MQIITDPAGKELKKHGDSSFPFLVSYERLSGYETGSFLWHWHPEIRNLKVSAGAGFIVALTGDIMTMPGLPKVPAAERIDVDDEGRITGLF